MFFVFFFVSLSLPSLRYVRSGSHPLAKDATRLSLDCASAKLCLARTSSSWHRNHYHSFPPPRGKSETKMKNKKKTRTRSLLLVSLSLSLSSPLSRHLSVSSSYRSLPGTGKVKGRRRMGMRGEKHHLPRSSASVPKYTGPQVRVYSLLGRQRTKEWDAGVGTKEIGTTPG